MIAPIKDGIIVNITTQNDESNLIHHLYKIKSFIFIQTTPFKIYGLLIHIISIFYFFVII